MAEMRHHANRNLRRRTLSNGDTRGLPNYFAFTHGERPSWWSEEHEGCWGEPLGVYENVPGSSDSALILLKESLIVLEPAAREVRYAEMVAVERFQKAPLDTEIRVRLRTGRHFSIPVFDREGAIADIIRFLFGAMRETA